MATAAKEKTDIAPPEEAVTLEVGMSDEPYIPPEPTKEELNAAEEVLKNLKAKVDTMGDEQVISALLQVVDVIEPFKTPEAWPADEEDEYHEARVVQNIAKMLCLGCGRIELDHQDLICLFRNKDKWMEGDRPKRGVTKKFDTRTQYLLEEKVASVEINFHHWLTMNPLQKVQETYHQLRSLGASGKKRRPDFSGYFDEIDLFGVRSFHEMVTLGHVVSRAAEVYHPHQLPLFAGEEWQD